MIKRGIFADFIITYLNDWITTSVFSHLLKLAVTKTQEAKRKIKHKWVYFQRFLNLAENFYVSRFITFSVALE